MTSKDSHTPAERETVHKDSDHPKGGHPGPTDEGKDGGMATRELAPELTDDN